MQRIVVEVLAATGCVDCGNRDVRVLEFDHLRDKRANVSELLARGHSVRALRDEIAKCEVVCRNCHRRRTWRRRASIDA
jgi:L-lysine 2,3-aminomutase